MEILFVGDFCSKPSTSKISVSDELKALVRSCDFRVVNFEVPLKPENVNLPPQKRERFYQHDDAPDFLRSLGFNLFQLANNHAFDWGEEGFKKTRDALGDAVFGAGTYAEAYQVKIVEKDGIKIGFLAVSYAAYTGVFDDVLHHKGMGCAYINDYRVNHDIIEAKRHVDYLFVLPHDGIEYIDIPLPETIARYRDFIEYGADGVIASHPHCPQGWEEYKGKPIFYSIGNFFFNSKETPQFKADKPHWYEGLCVVIIITDGNLKWKVINTRNMDNICIEIDHDEARHRHNESVCRYLADTKEYGQCLRQVCAKLGNDELLIVDKTFHPQNLKTCTKTLMQQWMNRIKGKKATGDYPLQRLLSHDARRHLLMWTIKNNEY